MNEPTDRERILESQLEAANARLAELTRHDPVYRAAVRHFGEVACTEVASQDMGTLATALAMWVDADIDPSELPALMADVEIAFAELRVIVGGAAVDAAKVAKLDRLVRRMGGGHE